MSNLPRQGASCWKNKELVKPHVSNVSLIKAWGNPKIPLLFLSWLQAALCHGSHNNKAKEEESHT